MPLPYIKNGLLISDSIGANHITGFGASTKANSVVVRAREIINKKFIDMVSEEQSGKRQKEKEKETVKKKKNFENMSKLSAVGFSKALNGMILD